jgi:hypothetical protein
VRWRARKADSSKTPGIILKGAGDMKGYLNFFTILGILFLGGAAIAYFSGASFRDKAVLTTGTVTGFTVSVDSEDNSESYCPQVRYQTKSGETFTYFSNFCSSPPGYEVGEKVEIFYDPENPDKGQIKGFWSQYLLVTIFSCIGLPLAILGIWAGIPAKGKSVKDKKE